jgi:EAL domain-containing protein (putative c-di-GMP-specific phosphodiesterase class I)/GGDEF domain-containing protein
MVSEPLVGPEGDYYRLRTEWLRFKSHLFDSLTGLPALPAVMEDIRRLLESRGGAEVVYLDLGRSGWHETKLGWAAYDHAVRDFARVLSVLKERGDLGPHDVVCLHTVRSDRFLLFLPGGAEERRDAASGGPRTQKLLVALGEAVASGMRGSGLAQIRLAAGHAQVREDPMIRAERAIQQAVSDAIMMSLVDKEGLEASRRAELSRMIIEGGIRSIFHPIVTLDHRKPIGHEALTRPLLPGAFDSVEEMFAFAEGTELLMEFERLCRATAIRSAVAVESLGLLFLNASARAVEDPEWTNGEMDRQLARSGVRPEDVVVEITERVAIVRHDAFQSALRTFKERGFKVAVDDMGAGYSSFQALASIEPDFLKFDVSLVRDIDKSSIKRSLLESLRVLADKIKARVIAEGIEREEERATLQALGIELGQGFLFHREE